MEGKSWRSVATLRTTSLLTTRTRCLVVPSSSAGASSSPGGVLWSWAHLAQGSLKRYQMISITLSSAESHPHPPVAFCPGGLTSPRGL